LRMSVKSLTADEVTFDVDLEIARQSVLIRDILDEAAEDDEPIPLPYVNADILRKFLQVDQETLVEPFIAAEFLDIKGLLEACCKSVANMIKGKTVEEIRETFNVESDSTSQEEEQVTWTS
uniref:Skp1 domain-containing protein n=1 Tax=Taenia asiatica TaxID=60517 RepID=A0A0R3VWP3_TAEAS